MHGHSLMMKVLNKTRMCLFDGEKIGKVCSYGWTFFLKKDTFVKYMLYLIGMDSQ